MKPIISIVVPIFNVAQYLERCINSLIVQTINEIEIILINDGSTDNSLEICYKYKNLDSRIVVINQENSGVSSARNEGIKASNGTYIGFIDPDDYVEKNMFEKLYKSILQNQAEVAFCDFLYTDQNKKKIEISLGIDKPLLEKDEILDLLVKGMIAASDLNSGATTISGSACRLLVRKNLLIEHQIEFKKNIFYMEDLVFVLDILLSCNKVGIVQESLYHYILRDNSAVTSYQPSFYKNNMQVYEIIESLLHNKSFFQNLERRMKIRYVNICFLAIANEMHSQNSITYKKKRERILTFCKDKYLKEILRDFDFSKYTFRKKLILNAVINDRVTFIYLYYKSLHLLPRLIK